MRRRAVGGDRARAAARVERQTNRRGHAGLRRALRVAALLRARVTTLDLTGVLCPMNWVRARLELERMRPGARLELVLDSGEALESVPRLAREEGHRVTVEGRH